MDETSGWYSWVTTDKAHYFEVVDPESTNSRAICGSGPSGWSIYPAEFGKESCSRCKKIREKRLKEALQ